MLNYIRHLRTKPEETKKQIILIALVVSMSIVVTIWLATLGVKNSKEKDIKVEEDNGPSPFSILTNSFSDTFKNIKSSVSEMNIGELKNEIEESKQNEISASAINNDEYTNEASQKIQDDNFNLEE